MLDLLKLTRDKPLGRLLGICFAPDDTAVPVFRHGHFHHFASGYFRINPVSDQVGIPISTGVRVGRYTIQHVQTKDSFLFTFDVCVRFSHDPRDAKSFIHSRIARIPESGLVQLVGDKAEHILRRCTADFSAETLFQAAVQKRLERRVTQLMNEQLKIMGISVLAQGFMLGKPAPDKEFKGLIDRKRRIAHLIDVLAADGELCVEDKYVIASATMDSGKKGGSPPNQPVLSMLMMQQLFSKTGETAVPLPTIPSRGHPPSGN